MNGIPLGVGPGRKVGNAIPVDTYNLTALLRPRQQNVLAIESYYRSDAENDPDNMGGVLAILFDGTGNVSTEKPNDLWKGFDATAAFSPDLGGRGVGAGTGNYFEPYENFDMRLYPKGKNWVIFHIFIEAQYEILSSRTCLYL